MKNAVAIVATLAIVGWAAQSGSAATSKPWHWTTSQAQSKLTSSRAGTFLDVGKVTASSCRGVGKQTPPRSGRYAAFVCTVSSSTSPTRRLWLRPRPSAPGTNACISYRSLSAIPAICLRARGLTPGRDVGSSGIGDLVRFATAERFTGERGYWRFTRVVCVGMDGFIECELEGDVAGRAAVLIRPSGPEVLFLSLSCVGQFAGRPECVV